MADPGAQTNWLDVIKGGFWPALALIFMLLFGRPLGLVLDRIATELGPTQEVDLGPVKVQFSPASVARLPPPPSAAALALAKMTPGDIETLLGMSANGEIVVCTLHGITERADDFDRQQAVRYDALSQIGLVDFSNPISSDDRGCASNETKGAKLTDLGRSTRSYLLSIINSAVTFSKS